MISLNLVLAGLRLGLKIAKWVKSGFLMIVPIYAKVSIKCQAQYYQLLTKVLNDIKAFKPLLS
ncbi:hypothetical protein BSPWISOXPB_10681 [uncultured Gammaproteobacteria bacterium]|nr:hypothetical protein BSPWISOXPB_10681 [uncultured Gammaproteobacteria bacterium]